MPNNLISSPIGLQAIVNKLQVALYEPLKATWNNAQLDGYPICYSKEKDGKRTIEHFTSGVDYKNLIYAEDNKFWFTNPYPITEVRNSSGIYETQLDLYFTVNLLEIKSQITTHRADYEVRKDVIDILEFIPEVRVNEIITQFDQVYRGFSCGQDMDFQPYHCFRIVLDVLSFRNDLQICIN